MSRFIKMFSGLRLILLLGGALAVGGIPTPVLADTLCTAFTDNRAYVDASASGATDGTNWTDAFTTLQSALMAANSCPNITQIWVAEGTYYPDEDDGGTLPDNDRLAYFGMKNDLGIYGGFAGDETELSQRDWKRHTTTLSGEIQQDNDSSNNSLNVVANFYSNESRLYNTAVLDGFTITGGNANGDRTVFIPSGSVNMGLYGGGMSNLFASPTVANCIFTGNTALIGGGFANWYSFDNPKIENTSFHNNSAQQGGGMYLFQFRGSTSGNTSGVLSNVNVSDNVAAEYGGGIIIADSSVVMRNMVVANNSAQGATRGIGGGIFSYGSSVILTNSTFFGNSATVRGGGIAYSQDIAGTSLTITNSIFWGNRAGANTISNITAPDHDFPSSTRVSYSNIEQSSGVFTGTGNINQDPLFLNSASPKGSDNIWLSADDGLQLQFGSPAINRGTNTGAPSADILGTPRALSAADPADMGAYEFQAPNCPAGKYSNGTTCVDASPGHYVPNAGAISQIDCALGRYQPNAGAIACMPADAGYYVGTTAAIAQTQCPAGKYQPTSGQSSCIPADPGHFVAGPGATVQTQCPAGRYQPASGQSSCILASPDYYVPADGATAQIQCSSGTTSDAGATACRPIDTTPPVITPTISGTLGSNGWYTSNVTVSWTISDPESTPTPSTCAPTTLSTNTAGTNVTCAASSLGGNNSNTVTIKIDKTPPACTAKVNTISLWSPNHKLTNVTTTVTTSNGAVGFKLLSVSSSEADSGLGTDDVAGDIQGWEIGTADTAGQLRSERYSSNGRTYTFVYQASDIAGNTVNCTASVSVPKSQGK